MEDDLPPIYWLHGKILLKQCSISILEVFLINVVDILTHPEF